jgi:branched-subunit amino acid ABC-type transport system permease component
MDIAQILINTMVRAAELSLLAIGLTMVFDILKFVNLVLSIILAAFVTGWVGILIDQTIFKRLRKIGAKPVTLMITSMGAAIALRNLNRLIWTSHTKTYAIPLQRPLEILGARITPLQIGIIVVGLLSMVIFHLLLHRTTFGKALRAISDNSDLANACAIDSEKMIKWMWFLASAYGVIGGSMIAMEHLLYPRLGFDIIIPVFCATILGGIGNPYGAMLGALTLAFAENSILALDFAPLINLGGFFEVGSIQISTGYKPAISFVILIIVLLFKPTGILRKK